MNDRKHHRSLSLSHLAAARWQAYLQLTKPRILSLVLCTAFVGYAWGAGGQMDLIKLVFLGLGVAWVCGGAGALNHYLERDIDGRMRRTCLRPCVTGEISPAQALAFGLTLVLMGVTLLAWRINLLTAFLGLLTAFLYVLVYTPLKRISWWNTTIGAIPGALPPLGGWAAATNSLDGPGWLLFAVLFLWQHPHFYAIAWMCRDEYARAGFQMLSVVDPSGRRLFRHVLIYSFLLFPVSLIPVVLGWTTPLYAVGVGFLGIWLLHTSHVFRRDPSLVQAKALLKTTVMYLPAFLLLLCVDLNLFAS